MSITKCFNSLNNKELQALYQDKLGTGMTEDAAAAAAIMEYSNTLNKRNNALRGKLGLAKMTGPNVAMLQEVVESQTKTLEDIQGKAMTEPLEDLDQDTVQGIEISDEQIEYTHKLPDGRLVTSYAEALNSVEEGQTIEIGMKVGKSFTPLVTTKRNTDKNTLQGFVNNMIANGALKEAKVFNLQGKAVYEVAGNTELRQAFSAALIADQATAYLGHGGVNQDGLTFDFDDAINKTTILANGRLTEVRQDELDRMSYQQLEAAYGRFTAVAQVTDREYAASKPVYREEGVQLQSADPALPEDQLQLRLLSLLNKMGVRVISITEYTKKYKIRHGVNPSAKALADIANQVVAIGEGTLMYDSLAEETAHFINEAMPQEQVRNLLRNVHRTEEWAEFAQVYREIYRDEYPEDQLDEVVRREVLGKIVAKVVANPTVRDEASTDTQRNFFARVYEAFKEFVRGLINKFKPQYKTELDAYLKDVEKLLLADEIAGLINTNNFQNNTFTFYDIQVSADPVDKLRRSTAALASRLQDAERTLLNAGTGAGKRSNVKDLAKIKEDLKRISEVHESLDSALEINSVASILSLLNTNVKRLEKAIETSQAQGHSYFFTDEENVLFQFIKNIGKGGVEEIKELIRQVNNLEKGSKSKEWEVLQTSANELALKISGLESRANLIDSQNVRRLVEEVMNKYNIPQSERAVVEAWIERAQHDTNLFHFAFGQMVHAQDGLLNLAGRIFRKMRNEGYTKFYHEAKRYQDRLKELGISEADVAQFAEDGYIIDKINHSKFAKFLEEVEVQSYQHAIIQSVEDMKAEIGVLQAKSTLKDGEAARLADLQTRVLQLEPHTTLTQEQLLELKRKFKLNTLSLKEETSKKNHSRKLLEGKIVRAMKQEYYDLYEQRMVGMSEQTKQDLSNIMSDIGDIRKKAFRRIGDRVVLDYSSLSESDLVSLKALQRKRKALKSYTTSSGKLKKGLMYQIANGRVVKDANGAPVIVEDPNEELSTEARAALDLHKLDSQFDKNEVERSAQLFYDTLAEIDKKEGRGAALRFLEANSFISFKQEFWENLGTTQGISERLDTFASENPELEERAKALVSAIEMTSFQIKSIIREHTKKNNPAEVDAEMMEPVTQDRIKDLQNQLQDYISQANSLIGPREATEEDGEEQADKLLSGTTDVNQAYRDELDYMELYEDGTDSPAQSLAKANAEVDFATKHMTPYSAASMQKAKVDLNKYAEGIRNKIPRPAQVILDEMGISAEDLRGNQELLAQVLRRMSRKKVLPYYKRFTPPGFTEFYDALQDPAIDLVAHLRGPLAQSAFVQVDPNYSFFSEEENENINPEYDQEYEGGYLQANPTEFRGERFYQLFGDVVNGVPQKNQNLYKAYQATLDFNRNALDAMNVGENFNKFKMPQIRKQKVQRFMDIVKGKSRQDIKNLFKDTLTFTEDEMVEGDKMYGDNVKIIPKMYIRDLENPEDVSNDLFFSLTMRAKEAYLREAKVKHYGDIMSIQDKILTRDMNGKDPDKSNTYKMFKSALDYNMFGVKESVTQLVRTPFGTFDLAKLGRLLLSFVKFRNLGLNLIIPATSALTGGITRKIEAVVGEYVDVKSQRRGSREFTKLMPEGMVEMGKINQKAKLNALGQFYNAFDMEESYQNSNYSYLLRSVPRLGMFLHSAANYPLYSKAMLGILHDYRVVDGRVMNKNQFKKLKAEEGLGFSAINKEWAKYDDSIIYEYITHDGNRTDYNRVKLAEVVRDENGQPFTEEKLEEFIANMHNDIQGNIQFLNSIIDGQIPEDDRVYAQRHFLLSYLMTHRGWLSIAVARRFKNRHLNLDTQVLEEGSYRSFYGYMLDVIKNMSPRDPISVISAWKKAWNEVDPNNPAATDLRRKNMRRVGVEVGALAGLMALTLLLRYAAEDPDNEDVWSLQVANYLAFRTLNELSSVQFNIVTNFSDAVESPFVGWNLMKNMAKAGDLFDGEEVKYGPYKGMTQRDKYLIRMVPGFKQGFDLYNMNQTYETYKFYNMKNFSFPGPLQALTPGTILWANTIDAPEE